MTLALADTLARLTDSAPPNPATTTAQRRICAWCPTFDPTLRINQGATHVMCPTCVARLRALEARR